MEFFNLLSDVSVTLWGQTYDIYLNWIGKIIRWLIESIGNVGLGVIAFSLILKIIVLPFDVSQRVSMRKQNAKMKENQEKMAKLQKQYANNKELYNQKLMETYKESGISMFSSCLPMILSMVIFIVAINAFNAYSQYAAVENYNMMVGAYNASIQSYAPELEEGKYTVSEQNSLLIVKGVNADDYVYCTMPVPDDGEATLDYIKNAKKTYMVDTQKLLASEYADEINELLTQKDENGNPKYDEGTACKTLIISLAQEDVADEYIAVISERTRFLWIKNIWNTDAAYTHPVNDYENFITKVKNEKFDVNGSKVAYADVATDVYGEAAYEIVTQKLDKQKNQANGYFILIALSVGTILLQQWISMRSQKEQTQFSTVDGQGAQQQKTTMIMMTITFAFFSFSYSSAFSLYMITSNLTSLASTLVINKFVDKTLEKKEQEAMQARYNQRFPGRVYKGGESAITVTDTKKKKEKKNNKDEK